MAKVYVRTARRRIDILCNYIATVRTSPQVQVFQLCSEVAPSRLRVNYVVEAHCYLSISGELIVSRYVAESITMIAGRFGHVGLCQLRTKLFCTQLTKAYVAETSCNHCY